MTTRATRLRADAFMSLAYQRGWTRADGFLNASAAARDLGVSRWVVARAANGDPVSPVFIVALLTTSGVRFADLFDRDDDEICVA